MKIINYLKSTVIQEHLSYLSSLSFEYDTARSINFHEVIDDFALVKAKKKKKL